MKILMIHWMVNENLECLFIFPVSRASNKRDFEVNSGIIFLISHENICCDPSLEPSH